MPVRPQLHDVSKGDGAMNKNWVITGALVAAVVFLALVVTMQSLELRDYSAFQIGLFK
jgi:hypothetical protein